jgi:hypothetical protein
MFRDVLDNFAILDISDKRKAINDELMYLTLFFEQTCKARNVQYRNVLDDEVKELIRDSANEDEYLNKVYTYLEAIKEMVGSLLERE